MIQQMATPSSLNPSGTERPVRSIHTPDCRKEVSSPDEWRNAVRETFKRGADVIKVAGDFIPEEVPAAVEEAHNLGLRVTCDCETFYIQWAVEAGVDVIEHPLPRSEEAIRLMAERHVAADPTLIAHNSCSIPLAGVLVLTGGRIFDSVRPQAYPGGPEHQDGNWNGYGGHGN
jgi:imidazolonepropionase-like amidohydrolase